MYREFTAPWHLLQKNLTVICDLRSCNELLSSHSFMVPVTAWGIPRALCGCRARVEMVDCARNMLWLQIPRGAASMAQKQLSFSSSPLKCFCLFPQDWMNRILPSAGSLQLSVFCCFFLKERTLMPNAKVAVGEIGNQLSCNFVWLYQPWPWQNEEFPETLRKGLSHSQCHRRAGQEAERMRWVKLGVSLMSGKRLEGERGG